MPDRARIDAVDKVVRHACVLTNRRQVRDEPAERGAVGEKNREVIESDLPSTGNRAHSRLLMELDEHMVVTANPELGNVIPTLDNAQSDHTFIISDRAIEVGDLQANATDVRRVRESVSRRPNAVRFL